DRAVPDVRGSVGARARGDRRLRRGRPEERCCALDPRPGHAAAQPPLRRRGRRARRGMRRARARLLPRAAGVTRGGSEALTKGRSMKRREFLGAVAAATAAPALLRAEPAGEWGVSVFDLHFHLRPQPGANLAHLDGAGIAQANLLTRGDVVDQVKALSVLAPGRFATWFASADVAKPDAEGLLTQAVKQGARGFGEMKFHVAADGPEYRRAYALAGELQVPILIHFQEVDHFPNEGSWATGYATAFESVLKANPKTTFIGHADAFWANVSADYHNEAA